MEKAEQMRVEENEKLPEVERRSSLAEWELYAWSGESGRDGLTGYGVLSDVPEVSRGNQREH